MGDLFLRVKAIGRVERHGGRDGWRARGAYEKKKESFIHAGRLFRSTHSGQILSHESRGLQCSLRWADKIIVRNVTILLEFFFWVSDQHPIVDNLPRAVKLKLSRSVSGTQRYDPSSFCTLKKYSHNSVQTFT